MFMKNLTIIAVIALTGNLVSAQQPTQPKPTPEPPPRAEQATPKTAQPSGAPVNIRVDLTITDQSGPGDSAKKTVSMLISDGNRGSIRSAGHVNVEGKGQFPVELNVDAQPSIFRENVIRLTLALEYAPKPVSDSATTGEGRAHLNERLSLYVTPGKPTIISQAADPTSERRIVVELTATILK
jgi:hypothetical protein